MLPPLPLLLCRLFRLGLALVLVPFLVTRSNLSSFATAFSLWTESVLSVVSLRFSPVLAVFARLSMVLFPPA